MLRLTDEELETFTPQLAAVLEHAEDVEALDVHGLEPTQHPYPLVNVFRADVVEGFDNRDAALAMGPEVEDDLFRVPPAHGEEP
ncbi:MAG: Asp-tRNA(Asn)/Glu-tRNA(Gln) amidotransferase subunit GatC [Acidimicrobiales bacterium]|nr:Asp-tRNA(Asn)/Glu-tRNA(Gln) amidotransferase subunit GatC [Acidimicrobiales bacterium]